MMLDDLNKLSNLFILLLQVISQSFIVLKKLFVLLIESLQLACRFGKVHLLLLIFALYGALEFFLRSFILLSHRLNLVPQSSDFLFFELVHLL